MQKHTRHVCSLNSVVTCQLVRASCLICFRVGERRECVRAFTKDVDGTGDVMVAQMD